MYLKCLSGVTPESGPCNAICGFRCAISTKGNWSRPLFRTSITSGHYGIVPDNNFEQLTKFFYSRVFGEVRSSSVNAMKKNDHTLY